MGYGVLWIPPNEQLGTCCRMQVIQPAFAGKWQLDGGDNSIRKFGFDKYSVWLPFKGMPGGNRGLAL